MKIEKLPSGSYRMRKTYKGKTYTVVVDYKPTQKEALELMSNEMNVDLGLAQGFTFEGAVKDYIKAKSNVLSPTTARNYLSYLNSYSDKFKRLLVARMAQLDVQLEVNRLSANKSPKTVRNLHGLISAVLKMYRPDLHLSTTLPQRVKKEAHIPTDEEVRAILAHVAGTKYEVGIILAVYGLRRSEICALTLDDLNGRELTINKAMVQGSDKTWTIKTTKTVAGTRTIVIPQSLAHLIRERGEIFSGYPNMLYKALRDAQRALDIEPFRLHDLRHYFASKLSAMGVPEADILKLGGWNSDHIMKSVYRHSMYDKDVEVKEAISDKLEKAIS